MKDAIWLWEAKAFFELEKEKIKQDELKNDYEFKHKLMLYLHGVQEILFDLTCDHKNKYQRKEPLDRAELPIFREIVEELKKEEEKLPLEERKRREAMRIYEEGCR